jgi:hypothetical protein
MSQGNLLNLPGFPANTWQVYRWDRVLNLTSLISQDPGATLGPAATQHCFSPTISDDGDKVAYHTVANMSGGDTNGLQDVYVRDVSALTNTRVSIDLLTLAEPNGNSFAACISPDGTLVAFTSRATNLTGAVDANGALADVFVVDSAGGIPELVSVNNAATPAQSLVTNFATYDAAVAPSNFYMGRVLDQDGSRVLFCGTPCDWDAGAGACIGVNCLHPITPGGTPCGSFAPSSIQQVYLRDRALGITFRVSRTVVGGVFAPGTGFSRYATIDYSGNEIAFASNADNYCPGTTTGIEDVFLIGALELGLNTNAFVPVQLSFGGNAGSTMPKIGSRGVRVAFESSASNLVVGDTNGKKDVFLFDNSCQRTFRYSVSSDGVQGNNHSYNAAFTDSFQSVDFVNPGGCNPLAANENAMIVAYLSDATNLVLFDTNGARDVFETMTRPFIRGDVSGNGLIEAGANGEDTDQYLDALYNGNPPVTCSDLMDVNDDGSTTTADFFALNAMPASPTCIGPAPTIAAPCECTRGRDPTPDNLSCNSYPACPTLPGCP